MRLKLFIKNVMSSVQALIWAGDSDEPWVNRLKLGQIKCGLYEHLHPIQTLSQSLKKRLDNVN